jgi:2-keto-4-pentenoate hydratase/2-oxohepta-3-ene-1,7-dioic acid hydratase in catechol pathway
MKLATCDTAFGEARLGALIQNNGSEYFLDLERAGDAAALDPQVINGMGDMLTFIEMSDDVRPYAEELVESLADSAQSSELWTRSEDLKWRCPILQPPQLRDCLMFEEHLQNAFGMLRKTLADQATDPDKALKDFIDKGLYNVPEVWYQIPVYYKVNRFSFIGHEADIIWPYYSEKLDFELEFACVLKNKIKDVSEEVAADSIFGYTIYNDISARDTQSVEMQAQLGPSKGKDFDTGNILGPCIVTADEINPRDLTMLARINGEELCRGNSGSSQWTFPQVISYISRSETLYPGEMIGSGTVGWGCGLEHGRFLQPGDIIELEVSGIGTLRNRIVRN